MISCRIDSFFRLCNLVAGSIGTSDSGPSSADASLAALLSEEEIRLSLCRMVASLPKAQRMSLWSSLGRGVERESEIVSPLSAVSSVMADGPSTSKDELDPSKQLGITESSSDNRTKLPVSRAAYYVRTLCPLAHVILRSEQPADVADIFKFLQHIAENVNILCVIFFRFFVFIPKY